MKKQTQTETIAPATNEDQEAARAGQDPTPRCAVVYYRYARNPRENHERKVAAYFAERPGVPVVATFRETNPSTRPVLWDAIDRAKDEGAAIVVAGEYRKGMAYEVICGTLSHEGVPFCWLEGIWATFFIWGWPEWPAYPGDDVAGSVPWLEFGRLTLAHAEPLADEDRQGHALAVADWCEENGLAGLASCWRHWAAAWPQVRDEDRWWIRVECEAAIDSMCRDLALMALGRGHLLGLWQRAGSGWFNAGQELHAVGTDVDLEFGEPVEIDGQVMFVGEVRPGRVVLVDLPDSEVEDK